MKLSLVSQSESVELYTLLAMLRASCEYSALFSDIEATLLANWDPSLSDAAIFVIRQSEPWSMHRTPKSDRAGLGLPVLPLCLLLQDVNRAEVGPDVQDTRFYFVSNGISLAPQALTDAANRLVLSYKLDAYGPLLGRLSHHRKWATQVELSVS